MSIYWVLNGAPILAAEGGRATVGLLILAADGGLTTVGLLVLLALLAAFCSGTETALLSANRARLEALAAEGRRDARSAVAHLEAAPRAMAVLLVGTNLGHVGASALATAVASGWVGEFGPGVATIVMTPLLLVGTEIIPKALFRTDPTRLLRRCAGALRFLSVFLAPISFLAAGAARILLAPFRIPNSKDAPVFRREDLQSLFAFGEVHHHNEVHRVSPVGDGALRMAGRALDLRLRTVADAMQPLPADRVCPVEGTVADARERFREVGGRFLAAVDEGGRVDGFIVAKTLLAARPAAPLVQYVRPAFLLAQDAPLDEVLRTLRRHEHSVGLVRDRHGSTVGVLTPVDIFEEVVGDLPTRRDTHS